MDALPARPDLRESLEEDVEGVPIAAFRAERSAQCRALLRMLSSIGAPAAAEVLSAARRFPELREIAEKPVTARAGPGGAA